MLSFEIRTNKKTEIVDITGRITENMGKHIDKNIGKKSGTGTSGPSAILIFAPHATAAITIGEYEPNIKEDMERFYRELAAGTEMRAGRGWKHDTIDDNAGAHLMSSLIKPSLAVPVEDGKLVLGTWQRILFVELDGPRARRIITTLL